MCVFQGLLLFLAEILRFFKMIPTKCLLFGKWMGPALWCLKAPGGNGCCNCPIIWKKNSRNLFFHEIAEYKFPTCGNVVKQVEFFPMGWNFFSSHFQHGLHNFSARMPKISHEAKPSGKFWAWRQRKCEKNVGKRLKKEILRLRKNFYLRDRITICKNIIFCHSCLYPWENNSNNYKSRNF